MKKILLIFTLALMPLVCTAQTASTYNAAPPNAASVLPISTTLPAATANALAVTVVGSATPRSLHNRFAREYHIEDFGGNANGAVDNLVAFNAAISAIQGVSSVDQGGGCILLSRGTYYVSAPIDISGKNGICIKGEGQLATVVKSAGNYEVFRSINTIAAVTTKQVISDLWVQCSGKSDANANGIRMHYTNTARIENVFFTNCNRGIEAIGSWQLQLKSNRWDGADPNTNNICLYMGLPTDKADSFHNNAVIATNNICQSPAQYGLRWLEAAGSLFTSNQWMGGIHGIYGCDPGTPFYVDGTPVLCQFVFHNGDQVDTNTGEGIYIARGMARELGVGMAFINPWSGNTVGAGIDIRGANNGMQIFEATVASTDIGIRVSDSDRVRVSAKVTNYNRNNNGSAGVALIGATNSNIDVTTQSSNPTGYNGIVESGRYSNNALKAGTADCTLTLAYTGGNAGITYGARSCKYEVQGTRVTMQVYMEITNGGSSKGQAILGGLPLTTAPASPGYGYGGTSTLVGSGAFAGLTGPVVVQAAPGSTTAVMFSQGPVGQVSVTDANFTNSSTLAGTISYMKQ